MTALSVGWWLLAQATVPQEATPPPAAPQPSAQVSPSAPTVPQGRADENAVRQAQDAFGTTIGRETIGIYNSGSVRGFSPIAAGNARIDGLYFDATAAPNERIRRSTSIKVGLSAQGYLFPAPTGVVDYALRRPGDEALLSTTVGLNTLGDKSLEFDAELPLAGGALSLGAGLGLYDHVFNNGATSRQHVEGLTLRWRPRPGIELLPFWGRSDIDDSKIGPLLTTAGPYLPPPIRRGVFYGPAWAVYSGPSETAGLIGSAAFAGGWKIEAGVFRALSASRADIFTFLDQITPDGRARYIAFSDPPYRRVSVSGEVRVTRTIADGPRVHNISVSARGRARDERVGGSAFLDFGDVRLGDPLDFAKPSIAYGAYSRDRVRQWFGGIAYTGRWRGVGELSAGLSRTDYAKRFQRPNQPALQTRDRPWLFNVAGALYAGDHVAFYAGYTRGLEEAGLPPQNATNRNQPLPAILTSQRDAGVRWSIAGDVKLVAGVFDVRKPYLSLDPTGLFTRLGDIRNRGIEASLSGTPVHGLSVALGGVFLDPQVTGEARRSGQTGKRPVGVPLRSVDLNLDWCLPGFEALSLDGAVTHQGRVASTVNNDLFIPARTLVDVGSRYRFAIGKNRATLRVSVSNLFNVYAWDYYGPSTFDYVPQRTATAYLAVDF
ncbi:TonB-dependent receptor [uncultured Sphingomonas sp.]|uniref:TonB-dependent receptor n=1 Tax=uncultured Sphingomonas sp. TaxID=158754 RepID=UPI0025DA8FEA|nr:TonB-dependent receptor [uncultured Sphingomonas sp.]